MSVKVYATGGVILVEETGKDTKSFTPQATDLWVSGLQVGFTELISKETTVFGNYTDIVKKDDTVPVSLADAIEYLGSLFTFLKEDGSLDIYIQDQTSDIVDYFLCIQLFDLELSQNAVMDAYVVNVIDGSSVINGTYVCIQEGKRAFQAKVLSGGGTNILTLDSPMDYAFTTSAIIANRSPALNTDGSATPVIASLGPIPGVKWDITRIIGNMTHSGVADDGKFGGITALTKGMIIRKSNGVHHTIFNAKTNGELKERTGPTDVTYSPKAPAGLETTGFRRTFAGQDKNGVVIRLDGDLGDRIEMLNQDSLILLASFRIVAQGHVVE